MISAPILIAPIPGLPFVLKTDACDVGLGAVLTQIVDGRERVVAYHSRKLNSAERNYPTHEKELLSFVEAAEQWRHYLHGQKFLLKTDNWSNTHIQTQPRLDPKGQARWMEKLSVLDYDIEHIPGKHNVVADALSRRADYMLTSISMVASGEQEGLGVS